MNIRAVIFDLGGVINRTVDRGPREKFAERAGLSYEELSNLVFDTKTAAQATVGEVTTNEHWENVCSLLHLPAVELSEV